MNLSSIPASELVKTFGMLCRRAGAAKDVDLRKLLNTTADQYETEISRRMSW